MNWFNVLKIRSKLVILIFTVSMLLVLLVGGVRIAWDMSKAHDALAHQLTTLGKLLADRSSAALAFDDIGLANTNLISLHDIKNIQFACLYHADGNIMTSYNKVENSDAQCPDLDVISESDLYADEYHMSKTVEVKQGSELFGWLYLNSDLSPVDDILKQQLAFSVLALFSAIIISFLLAGVVQRIISKPIEEITKIAQAIEEKDDINLRADILAKDEVGQLARSFNKMLDALENNNNQLINETDKRLEASALYGSLIESTSAIPWEVDIVTKDFTYVGHQAKSVLGYSEENWYRHDFWISHIHEDDRERVRDLRDTSISSGEDYQVEYRMISVDGKSVWIHDDVKIIKKDGESVRVQGFMLDISIRKRHEEIIKNISSGVSSMTGVNYFQQLALQLSKLFNVAYVIVGLLDKENPNIIKTLVFSSHGVIQNNISYDITGTPCANVLSNMSCVYVDDVQQIFPDDEDLVDMKARSYVGTPLTDSKNNCLGHIALLDHGPMSHGEEILEILQIFASRTVAEIERIEADDQLRKKEHEQSDILNSMVDGVITFNQYGKILTFNQAAESIFEYSEPEILGKHISTVVPGISDDKVITTSKLLDLFSGGYDVKGLRKNKSEFYMRLSIAELPLANDGSRRFIGSCTDITELKQKEELIRRTQKMDALGKLTGGVAHDYNNMLGVIMGYADLLKMSLDDPKQLKYAEEIHHAGQRGANLTKRLLSFSRRNTSTAELVNLNKIILNEKNMLEKTLTARINLSLVLEENLWSVWIDANDMVDAILNMSINSMHAISDHGELMLKTFNRSIYEAESIQLGVSIGDYVVLEITDTGEGMDENVISKIFDPFFSTKGDKGTGLGLSQVYGFVKSNGGIIKAESTLGQGTSFSFYFPRHEESKDHTAAHDKDDVVDYSGSQTILIVDDEVALLEFASDVLENNGYKVLSTSKPLEALDILQSNHVDLLFSDVIMPEMDGYKLASIVKEKYPAVRVQLASGYTDNRNIKNLDQYLYSNLLPKPYLTKVLLECVHKALS